MPVPDFQSFFKPLLDIAADGNEHSIKEAREKIAADFQLSHEDLSELLPSGTQTKFDNRVAWAKSYFIQAGVLNSTRRAHFKITNRGKELQSQNHDRIDVSLLKQYPEFVEFHSPSTATQTEQTASGDDFKEQTSTPEELLQQSYESIRSDLANELLTLIKNNTPKFFENLVVDLMVAMGYGGSRSDAGRAIGQSGDEGIDGIINEDKLGLDVIYLQAKRWDGTVGRPEIQKFVGALHGKRAKKGVFITTGRFSDDAIAYVETIDPKVILINGRKLADYMIDYQLGTTQVANYQIMRVDSDYFIEE
ncbi:restriction endonuclease [Nitrospirota bacterium]